jgi:hypothetical protein
VSFVYTLLLFLCISDFVLVDDISGFCFVSCLCGFRFGFKKKKNCVFLFSFLLDVEGAGACESSGVVCISKLEELPMIICASIRKVIMIDYYPISKSTSTIIYEF